MKKTKRRGRRGTRETPPSDAPAPHEIEVYPADNPGRLPAIETRGFAHRLLVHKDVTAARKRHPRIGQRLALVMTQLAAHGRTSITMTGGGASPEWRRSPLGGEGAAHYYLWWHERPTTHGPDGSRGADILLRTVREDGDAAALDDGAPAGYSVVDDPEKLEATAGGRPWTPEQTDFALGTAPVRLIEGRPGAGKTTALWLAADAREQERILYLTWSRHLVKTAAEHFRAFAPKSTTIYAMDFRAFLEHTAQTRIDDASAAEAAAAIRKTLGESRADQTELLEAELRGIMYGRAAGGRFARTRETPADEEPGLDRLGSDEYRAERARQWGSDQTGLNAVAERLCRVDRRTAARAFPELQAATAAARRLRTSPPAGELGRVDRIVVDEVQDLTLVELWPILELFKSLARDGLAPKLLAAGDAAQTVRASGFDWNRYSAAIGRELKTRPASFSLEGNARAPARIAGALERLRTRYRGVDKGHRPTRQQGAAAGDETVQADLAHVRLNDGGAGQRLVRRLAEEPLLAIVQPDPEPAGWINGSVRELAVDPERVKGLEYQTVCVLDAERMLGRVATTSGHGRARSQGRASAAARMLLDRLNVACSRATTQLVMIDVAGAGTAAVEEILGTDAAEYSADDIVGLVSNDDLSPADRAALYLDEAEKLGGEHQERAWQRTLQATRLLGPPALPGAVADPRARGNIRCRALSIAAAQLLESYPGKAAIVDADLIEIIGTDLPATGDPEENRFGIEASVMEQLSGASEDDDPAKQFVFLLEQMRHLKELAAPDRYWPEQGLEQHGERLAEKLADHAGERRAAKYINEHDVRAWLKLLGYAGDIKELATECAAAAYRTLDTARADETDPERKDQLGVEMEHIVQRSYHPLPEAKARALEARGRLREAAAWHRMSGQPTDEIRCLRLAGAWAEAYRKSQKSTGTGTGGDDTDDGDLAWLAELETLASRRPGGVTDRLDDTELDQLFDLLGRIWPEAVQA